MISNSQYHLRTHFCAHVETTSQEYSTTITFRAILSYTFIYVGVMIVFRCCIPLFIKHYEIIVFYAKSTSCKIFNKIALITIPIQNEKRFMDYFWKNISKEIFLKLFER